MSGLATGADAVGYRAGLPPMLRGQGTAAGGPGHPEWSEQGGAGFTVELALG